MTTQNFSLGQLCEDDTNVELVERKGKGHPDTMADALSEAFSRALSNQYLKQCGTILHHNVDKLLIAAGLLLGATGSLWQEPVSAVLLAPAPSQTLELWLPFWPFQPFLPLLFLGLGTWLLTPNVDPALPKTQVVT